LPRRKNRFPSLLECRDFLRDEATRLMELVQAFDANLLEMDADKSETRRLENEVRAEGKRLWPGRGDAWQLAKRQEHIYSRLDDLVDNRPRRPKCYPPGHEPRQTKGLTLGKASEIIADELGIDPRTVRRVLDGGKKITPRPVLTENLIAAWLKEIREIRD